MYAYMYMAQGVVVLYSRMSLLKLCTFTSSLLQKFEEKKLLSRCSGLINIVSKSLCYSFAQPNSLAAVRLYRDNEATQTLKQNKILINVCHNHNYREFMFIQTNAQHVHQARSRKD